MHRSDTICLKSAFVLSGRLPRQDACGDGMWGADLFRLSELPFPGRRCRDARRPCAPSPEPDRLGPDLLHPPGVLARALPARLHGSGLPLSPSDFVSTRTGCCQPPSRERIRGSPRANRRGRAWRPRRHISGSQFYNAARPKRRAR